LEAREPDRPRRSRAGAPDSKFRDTHQLHLCRAPALIVARMLRSAISTLRASCRWLCYGSRLCGAARRALHRVRDTRDRAEYAAVPRMLRSAISAFTRVFDALCLCGVVRCWSGVHRASVENRSGSAEQREERCTASGTRAEFALAAVK